MQAIFPSARAHHSNDGSELGRTKDVFLRWTQVSALNPLFENGGNGEHRPWVFDDETLTIYRKYLWLHEELRPFYYSRGNDAFEQGMHAVMFPGCHYTISLLVPRRYGTLCGTQVWPSWSSRASASGGRMSRSRTRTRAPTSGRWRATSSRRQP